MENKVKKGAAAVDVKKPESAKTNGVTNLQKFIDFLIFIRDNHLEEFTRFNIKTMREMDIPLLKLFTNLTEEQLMQQSIKGFKDNISNLMDGSYWEKQKTNLKLWEEDKLPGIPRDAITPNDLLMIYDLQKKGYYKYLPVYTKDQTLSIQILSELDQLNLPAQKDAFTMLFRLNKEAEEKAKKAKDQLAVNEERLRQFTQHVKDYAIIMLDPKGNIITWAPGAEKMKGYTADEILGKNINVFYTKEDVAKGIPTYNLEQALKRGHYETQGWRVRKDRSLFWADIVITTIYGDDGELKGFAKITRDLTERKRIEEQMKNTNAFLDSVLENIPNMVFVKDARDLRFIRFNVAGERLLGYNKHEMLGKNDHDFFPKEQADAFTANDRAVLDGTEVVDIPEEEINTATGKKWLHTRKIAIKDTYGKPLYLLGISEDITERKEREDEIIMLNRELVRNNVQLETVNKELEAFSYSVSHDLRAPLRAIHGYTKILLEDYNSKIDEDGKHMMDAVMSNAIKMGQLIDDLLAFSRMGKKELMIGPVDMTLIAATALNNIKEGYEKPLKANITLHPLLPASADYNLMEQVFGNLISNAIKYSSKVDTPTIEISSYHANGENIYYVKDNGVGFDMRYYDKLFGVFQRLHSNAEFDGTGVGLALVKRIVSRHGGRVWAEAEPNKGATFYLALNKDLK
jgi:PAS domain S-box-containing protein